EVENTTRNLGTGQPLREAILLSAQQVALPALASTLAICIVFVPVAFLAGVAQSLFQPLAFAVVFAMLASYLLSRTLVTTMMQALMGPDLHLYRSVGRPVPSSEFRVPGDPDPEAIRRQPISSIQHRASSIEYRASGAGPYS